MGNNLITIEGYNLLLEKIDNLRDKLKIANNDVSEGATDYDFREDSRLTIAMEEREKIQKKLESIETVINESIITRPDHTTDSVSFGRSAKVINLDTDEPRHFTIVGIHESDPKQGKISYRSPFGQALLNLAAGDEFEVITPTAETYWEVLEVL